MDLVFLLFLFVQLKVVLNAWWDIDTFEAVTDEHVSNP